MKTEITDVLGKASSRFIKQRLFIVALVIAVLVICLISFFEHPTLESVWNNTRRPSEASINSKELITLIDHDVDYADEDLLESSTPSNNIYNLHVHPSPPPPDMEEYLAVCLLVKEVVPELREFFTHHYYHHGIRRFYIYDDGSNPPLADSVGSYNVPDSVLSFSYIDPTSIPPGDEREHLQDHIMGKCINDHGSKHHWMALLDPDEYVEMRHAAHPVLLDWLKEKEKNDTVGALAISWLPHNSADLIAIPEDGFRKSYNRCVSDSGNLFWTITHSKSFVRPQFVSSIPNIHMVYFNNENVTRYGEHMDDGFPVTREPVTHEFWALHHYATGSREYFEEKRQKGRSQGPEKYPVDESYWQRYHSGVESYVCDEMVKYEP